MLPLGKILPKTGLILENCAKKQRCKNRYHLKDRKEVKKFLTFCNKFLESWGTMLMMSLISRVLKHPKPFQPFSHEKRKISDNVFGKTYPTNNNCQLPSPSPITESLDIVLFIEIGSPDKILVPRFVLYSLERNNGHIVKWDFFSYCQTPWFTRKLGILEADMRPT